MFESSNLRNKLSLLENLSICETTDARILEKKLAVLKDLTLIIINEIESFEFVRPINLSEGINLHEEMRIFEVHLIQSALERTGGHQTKAAQMLGINLTTLHNKLKRLNISINEVINAPIIHEDSILTDSIERNLSSFEDQQFSQLSV